MCESLHTLSLFWLWFSFGTGSRCVHPCRWCKGSHSTGLCKAGPTYTRRQKGCTASNSTTNVTRGPLNVPFGLVSCLRLISLFEILSYFSFLTIQCHFALRASAFQQPGTSSWSAIFLDTAIGRRWQLTTLLECCFMRERARRSRSLSNFNLGRSLLSHPTASNYTIILKQTTSCTDIRCTIKFNALQTFPTQDIPRQYAMALNIWTVWEV